MIGATAAVRNYATIGDDDIVSRVLAGETELFEVLMRRFNQRLFRVARAILRDDARAEEAVQESYIRAFTLLGQLSERSAFGAWITRIVVRESLTRRKQLARETPFDTLEAARDARPSAGAPLQQRGDDPEQATAERQMRGFLERAIEELPEGAREVFVLREIEQLSGSETAACLGISDAAVRVRLHRARTSLRQALARELGAAYRDVYAFAGERCDRIVNQVLAQIV